MGGETIAAIATPPGKGAIAVVRVSGPGVRALASRLVASGAPLRARYATYASILDETGAPIDRGLAIFFAAPHSYTGEDLLELQVHGSPVVAREVMRALLACGARLAAPGEFTRRAFLGGKMDLHAAAAVADLIDAESRAAGRAALANLGGGLSGAVREQRTALTELLEELSGSIDFPEEVPEPDPRRLDALLGAVESALVRLRHDGELGRLVREGVTVAIVGPPNAGKSSLLNALLGEERALVSEIAGTTRDTIEEQIAIDGMPVRLVDTAGIRAHADRLEAAGIERTHRALEAARIALVVLDGSQPPGEPERRLLAATAGRERILFANKADLGDVGARELAAWEPICGSTGDPATLERLRRAIAAAGWGGERPDFERPHLVALWEFEAVNEALDALARARATLRAGEPSDLASGEIARAFAALGHVSGAHAAEEVLDGIFARFCIGK
ncbi:MAG TPA: tRNA uridine-5-carboxymethylaminomethyl(34) synthesis GTPase MnmE [Verrucomicrobiae bacterium]|nr:tRNA uridine-5-carboxymethylaminomethyl(34) synthesis GTPase MnmE [Verrucomicrobiae bacterium]